MIPEGAGSFEIALQHFEEAEQARLAACVAVAGMIDRRAKRANDFAAAFGQPELAFTVREKGCFSVQIGFALWPKMRHPMGIILINPPGEVIEGMLIGGGLDGVNGEVHK